MALWLHCDVIVNKQLRTSTKTVAQADAGPIHAQVLPAMMATMTYLMMHGLVMQACVLGHETEVEVAGWHWQSHRTSRHSCFLPQERSHRTSRRSRILPPLFAPLFDPHPQ